MLEYLFESVIDVDNIYFTIQVYRRYNKSASDTDRNKLEG